MLATIYSKTTWCWCTYFISKRKHSGRQPHFPTKIYSFIWKALIPTTLPQQFILGQELHLCGFSWSQESMEECDMYTALSRSLAVSTQITSDITEGSPWSEYQQHFHRPNDLLKSYFRSIWIIYFSNTQCNEIFQVIWTAEHKVQPTWDCTKTKFCSWELCHQRTFISLISFHSFHGLVATTEPPVVSWTRQKLSVSNSLSEYRGSKFPFPLVQQLVHCLVHHYYKKTLFLDHWCVHLVNVLSLFYRLNC